MNNFYKSYVNILDYYTLKKIMENGGTEIDGTEIDGAEIDEAETSNIKKKRQY